MATQSKITNIQNGRSRILTAALEIFAKHGFEGSSLRQIAQHAGLQHQLVVYHFRTKDALWREVVSSIFEESWRERGLSHWAEQVRAGQSPARNAARVRVVYGQTSRIT